MSLIVRHESVVGPVPCHISVVFEVNDARYERVEPNEQPLDHSVRGGGLPDTCIYADQEVRSSQPQEKNTGSRNPFLRGVQGDITKEALATCCVVMPQPAHVRKRVDGPILQFQHRDELGGWRVLQPITNGL